MASPWSRWSPHRVCFLLRPVTGPYTGLNRFGRTVDLKQTEFRGTATYFERRQYGYDDLNRLIITKQGMLDSGNEVEHSDVKLAYDIDLLNNLVDLLGQANVDTLSGSEAILLADSELEMEYYQVDVEFPMSSPTSEAGLLFSCDHYSDYDMVVLDRTNGGIVLHMVSSGTKTDQSGLASVSQTVSQLTVQHLAGDPQAGIRPGHRNLRSPTR